jgi:hypothetical protein
MVVILKRDSHASSAENENSIQSLWTRTNMETKKHFFEVDRREINYLRVTIESYDGIGVVRTIDPHSALIEVQVSPGCEQLFSELSDSLRHNEGISFVEKTDLI